MDYDELVTKVIELLQREKRVPYRVLKRRFDLDDDYIEDLKSDLIEAKQLAIDENDRILVWVGEQASPPPSLSSDPVAAPATEHEREPLSYTPKHLAEKILTSRNALEGERKQVTVLFCDLANSTPIAERLGPEHMHSLLHRFFELALQEIHRYEGTINQFLGDGFMALFGAPIAHEDHAKRGVLSALALQRTLKEADLGKPYSEACTFRMGLNSGLVVVGSIGDNLRMDYSTIGDTTNLAARLEQLAEPGDILISESTTRLVQGYVRLEALPPVQVKGKAAITDFQQMRDLAHRSGCPRQERESLCYLASAHHMKQTEEPLLVEERCAQEAMHLAHQIGDQYILAGSLARLGQVQQGRGDLPEADRHLGAALQISQRAGYTDVRASTLRTLCAQAYWQGCFQRAIHFGQDSVTVFRDTHNASSKLAGCKALRSSIQLPMSSDTGTKAQARSETLRDLIWQSQSYH